MSRRADGVLLDLDGTVYQEGHAIPGAAEALAILRRERLPFRFTTNTTRRPRSALAAHLRDLGIPARPEEILSAPATAARRDSLKNHDRSGEHLWPRISRAPFLPAHPRPPLHAPA